MDDHPDREWPHPSNWSEATAIHRETVELIRVIAYELLRNTGTEASTDQIIAVMHKPGK